MMKAFPATLVPTILAGGSGTRLWPVSRAAFPKHLVELFGEESLLQTTVRRALAADPRSGKAARRVRRWPTVHRHGLDVGVPPLGALGHAQPASLHGAAGALGVPGGAARDGDRGDGPGSAIRHPPHEGPDAHRLRDGQGPDDVVRDSMW